MFLKKLIIKNFRCIKNITIDFQKGLNLIIGENNTGKTAIIDALRLALSIGLPQREIYLTNEDFYIDQYGRKTNEIEFHLTFSDVSDEQQGIFYEMLAVNKDENMNDFGNLKLHVRYSLVNKYGIERIRYKYWGGDNEGGENIPSELMDLLYFVYLGALRDAGRDLKPCKGNRVGQLFLKLEGDQTIQDDYAKSIDDIIKKDKKWKNLINKAKCKINDHLEEISLISDTQNIDIDFLTLEFKKIVENLKLFLPFRVKIKRDEITEKIGEDPYILNKFFEDVNKRDLVFKKDFHKILDDDTCTNCDIKIKLKDIYNKTVKNFEIEQIGLGYSNLIYISTVLGDLLERRKIERESYNALLIEEPEAHLHPQLQDILFNYLKMVGEKHIQVFITSHSPTITSKASIDSTIVLGKDQNNIFNLPLKSCLLDKKDKKYLERFLDVTKSQLFFAKGVILVEGISEALLLPVFADMIGKEYSLDKNGIEVINIGGVSFQPFARLFNSDQSEKRFNIRCSIITDDDRKNGEESSRAIKTEKLRGGHLEIFLAEITFEYELYTQENKDILIEAYRNLHTKYKGDRNESFNQERQDFVGKIKNNKDKAEFAQELSRILSDDKDKHNRFIVPQYIQEAIKWAINKIE